MKKKDVLSSPRLLELKKARHKTRQRKLILFLCLFISIIIGLTYLSRQPRFKINDIAISGNQVVDARLIKSITEDNLKGQYFWLFPKASTLLYPRNKIKEDILNTFKRLNSIDLKMGDSGMLEVVVRERDGKYLWCGASMPHGDENVPTTLIDEDLCYFMDSEGYIFDNAPYFSGDIYFRFFGHIDGDEPLGVFFLREQFANFIKFKEVLNKMNLKTAALFTKDDGDVLMYLSSKSILVNSPKIIFKKDADLDKIVENLQAALSTDPLKSGFNNNYENLEYIDLSFGNKVYYKFR